MWRAAKGAGAREREETVAGYLETELTGIDSLLDELAAAVAAGDLAEGRRVQRRLEIALGAHVRTEEELLLPVFEACTGVAGPAASMRAEHRDVQRGVALMRAGLAESDLTEFRDGLSYLRAILAHHHSKEHVLYPTVDFLLSENERALLLERLRARGRRPTA